MGFIDRWHGWLGMPKFNKKWHQDDLADELAEFEEETKLLKKWSEISDVVYTCTRARWSGHNLPFPLARRHFLIGVPYMLGKYSGRFVFFRRAGRKAGADKDIRCVRNPKKPEKLDGIIEEQEINVDLARLKKVVSHQRRFWPLLP